jgi:hypothetical protein
MTFKKNHTQGFTSDNPLDRSPVCFKVKPGVREKLKAIPRWQERLRVLVDLLIQDGGS